MDSPLFKLIPIVLFVAIHSVSFGQDEGHGNVVEGELIVHLERDADIHQICALLSSKLEEEVQPKKRLLHSIPLWTIQFEGDETKTEKGLNIAWGLKGIEAVQFNHSNVVRRGEPDDPNFDEQWNFYNDGTNGGSGTADVDAKNAWDISTGGVTASGDTIVVAVIDGGFNINHEDLEQNIFVNRNEIPGNGVDDDNNGYVDDINRWNVYSTSGSHFFDNHGTHVAGTVGARGNNGIGVTGVNWNVKILPISGSSTIESTVLESYGYILDMRRLYNETNGAQGAYVVSTNSSFGVDYGDPLDFPLWCAMYDSMGIEGIISAGATANININIDEEGDVPTACPSNFLISVTNTTSSDVKNGGAAYGVSTIDIGAPGTSIYSTRNSGYGNSTGTSVATPHVAGAVALMQSAMCEEVLESYEGNPGGLAIYLKNQLLNNGVDVLSSLDGLVATSGRLNLFNAVSAVSDTCLTVVTNVINSACGLCDGEIDVQVLGGNPPFNFSWNTGATSALITNLCAGAYTVSISDTSGDSIVKQIAISDSLSPEIGWSLDHPTCHGSADGIIELDTGYNYEWQSGSTVNVDTGLQAGFYVVSITSDSSSCTAVEIIELIDPNPISATSNMTIPIPYSGSNGEIDLNISGGTPPYTVIWGDSTFGSVKTGLSVGWHRFYIIDANGCVQSDTVLLGYPAGVAEASPQLIRVYPNPATDLLQIISAVSIVDFVTIHDTQGRLIYQSVHSDKELSIDVSNLRSGIYIVNVKANDSFLRKTVQVIR